MSSLSCIAQPLLFLVWRPDGADTGGLFPHSPCSSRRSERWRHRAEPETESPSEAPGGGAREPLSDVGAGRTAVTCGGGAVPSPSRAAIHSKGAQLARSPVGSRSRAGHREALGCCSCRGRSGKEGARSPSLGSATPRPGQRDAVASGARCLPASLRKFGGAADAAAPAPRLRVLSRTLPRPDPRRSLSPLPWDLRVLRPRLQARPRALLEEPAGPGDAPGPANLDETGTRSGTGPRRLGASAARAAEWGSERCQPVTVGDTALEAAQPGRTCGRATAR